MTKDHLAGPGIVWLMVFATTGFATVSLGAQDRATDRSDLALRELRIVSAKAGLPVVSEVPNGDGVAGEQGGDQDLPTVLSNTSSRFDFHWIARPGWLAFQRRYSRPTELVALDLAELQGIGRDLYHLVHPFNPRPIDKTIITDKRDFVSSLTPAQMETMRSPAGMPFRSLERDQQKLWLTINAMHAFADTDAELARLKLLLEGWNRATLSAPFLTPNRRYWVCSFPNAALQSGEGQIHLEFRSRVLQNGIAFAATGQEREGLKGVPATPLLRKVTLKSPKLRVEDLIQQIQAAVGKSIAIPEYARERELLVVGDRPRARALIGALEDLFGWELRSVEGGKYRLDRPVHRTAANVVELQQKLLEATPPALRHLLNRSQPEMEAWRDHQMALVVPEAELPRLAQEKVRVTDLPGEAQRRLAQVLTVGLLHSQNGFLLNRETLRHWIRAPEEGFFRWDGPPTPIPGGRNPIVWFGVKGPDGVLSRWGWGVGTSSLDRK